LIIAAAFTLLSGSALLAQCDTSNDDTAALQALLDAKAAAGGGTVQLDGRVYKTTQALIIPSNVHLRGAGRGATIIRGLAAFFGPVINNSWVGATIASVGAINVSVSDLTVDHRTCSRNANVISFLPNSSSTGNGSYQLYDSTPTTNGLIERVEILGAGVPTYHNYMIWNLRGQHVKIIDNWVDGGSTVTSPQEGIESFGGYDVVIANNTVMNIGGACINLGSAGVASSETFGLFAVNNYLKKCNVGINLGTSNVLADQFNAHSHLRGNVITDIRLIGIDIPVMPGTHELDLDISHNTIRDVSASDQAAGIRLRSSGGPISSDAVSSNVIEGNYIANVRGANGHGIRLQSYPNVRVLNNTIAGTDHEGIWAYDTADLEVVGNRIEVCPLSTCTSGLTGISVQKGTTGIDRLVIERNVIGNWSTQTGAILIVGAKWGVVRDNSFKRGDSANPSPIVFDQTSCGVTVTGNRRLYYRTDNWTEPTTGQCSS
jgi:hypothetical protein